MIIDVYSHGFTVKEFSRDVIPVINRMIRFMGHYELQPTDNGRYENVWTGVYGGAFADRSCFFFHISILDKFIAMVKDTAPNEQIHENVHPIYDSVAVKMIKKDFRPPRPGQDKAVEFIQDGKSNIKVICVEPGGGKTWILNQAMCDINRRMAMVIKPMYMDKWESDISEAHEVAPGDILRIEGTVSLVVAMRDALEGRLTAKYILISNNTYRKYLSLYEASNGGEFAYPVPPHELWGVFGCEVLAVDEGHQDFHFNHRLILFSHIALIVILSGTPNPDNTFKDAVTKLTYPPECRFTLPPIPPYLRITALTYGLKNRNVIKWSNRGRPDYSQVALEKSILKNKTALANYTQFTIDTVKSRFDKIYVPGRSLVVFAGTKLMVEHLRKALAKEYPKLRVKRLIGGDPYTNMTESDILVTTTKSFGTAKDKPGLAVSIMTEAVGDSQANEQHIARLRKPPEGPNSFTPEFVYYLCSDIQQHFRYHEKKKQLFAKKALSHSLEHSGVLI